MTPELLPYLCDPIDHSALTLRDAETNEQGHIVSGTLVSAGGRSYPIVRGIPRFTGEDFVGDETVTHFGNQWNRFNFDTYHANWLKHTMGNTFPNGPDALKGRLVVDCGAGSGMQTKWMREAGAKHVISLELSHAVDGIISQNLKDTDGVDIVQCSIDAPPIKPQSIDGIVICHNVIQHTPSVEKTASALWQMVAPQGKFVFNCYIRNDETFAKKLRFKLYQGVRWVLSKMPMWFLVGYARVVAALGLIPGLRQLLVKSMLLHQGEVPEGRGHLKRLYQAGVLNTVDYFGSHSFQHHKSFDELRALVQQLQPDGAKIHNAERFFARPQPIGAAVVVEK